MTNADLKTIVGFLEDNEAELAAYLMTGAGGRNINAVQADHEANAIIRRVQDYAFNSNFADDLSDDLYGDDDDA